MTGMQITEVRASFLIPVDLMLICSIGTEKETTPAEEEFVNADTIVPLLHAYPENATALDPSSPLTEDELLGE